MKKRLILSLLIILINTPLLLRISRIERGQETGGNRKPDITLTSASFKTGNPIDKIYTCFGKNASPQLSWENAPKETKSFAILAIDYDVPHPNFSFTQVIHWLVVNIPPEYSELPEGLKKVKKNEVGMVQGRKELAGFSMGEYGYHGPCPKMGNHKYYLRLYALSEKLTLPEDEEINRIWFLNHIQGKILGVGETSWTYSN